MSADSPRIVELRRRVQADPASIAFAQLAEELRRAGANDEAVEVCQVGLARHPGYLSARVTLGRALIELEQFDGAFVELFTVFESAPDNLAAIRGLAEIHQRRGENAEALGYYRRALELARHDPDLEETVVRMEKEMAPPAPAEPVSSVSVEDLFDFDSLVRQLGAEDAGPPAVPSAEAWAQSGAAANTGAAQPPADDGDPLAALEESLRAHELEVHDDPPDTPPSADAPGAPAVEEPPAQGIDELERWLRQIQNERP